MTVPMIPRLRCHVVIDKLSVAGAGGRGMQIMTTNDCSQPCTPVERRIWHYAFVHPNATAMKEVTIVSQPDGPWVHTCLRAKDGSTILGRIGRVLVNPCLHCHMFDEIGVGALCGQCRSRPVVVRMQLAQLGGHTSQCRGTSPRRGYFDMIQRRTCHECLTLYRHNQMIVDFIAEEGCCPTCLHRRTD